MWTSCLGEGAYGCLPWGGRTWTSWLFRVTLGALLGEETSRKCEAGTSLEELKLSNLFFGEMGSEVSSKSDTAKETSFLGRGNWGVLSW